MAVVPDGSTVQSGTGKERTPLIPNIPVRQQTREKREKDNEI